MKEKIIEFKSYDGYGLEGTFLKAKNEKGAVLFVHGITSSRDELGFHADYAEFLALNGFSSFRFDYRYHGINESSLKKLTLSGIVNDIDAAYWVLLSNATKGLDNYFIVGTSFGGGLSVYWADATGRIEIKKILLNAPVIDYEDDVLARNDLLSKNGLTEKAAQQLKKNGYIKSSGIHFGSALINELKYINGIKAIQNLAKKIEIFHGDMDEDVPIESSKQFMSGESKLHVIPGVGHGFGVEDDEDLDFPETKEIHRGIYETALKTILT